jgi:hypothetical protein
MKILLLFITQNSFALNFVTIRTLTPCKWFCAVHFVNCTGYMDYLKKWTAREIEHKLISILPHAVWREF